MLKFIFLLISLGVIVMFFNHGMEEKQKERDFWINQYPLAKEVGLWQDDPNIKLLQVSCFIYAATDYDPETGTYMRCWLTKGETHQERWGVDSYTITVVMNGTKEDEVLIVEMHNTTTGEKRSHVRQPNGKVIVL